MPYEDFTTVVIACDPRSLQGVMRLTTDESRVIDQLYNSVFCTHLLEVTNDKHGPTIYADVCSPASLEKTQGRLHAYRNELRRLMSSKDTVKYAKAYVVTYQLWEPRPDNPVKNAPTAEQFTSWLIDDIQRFHWFPWKRDYRIIQQYCTPYFSRFHPDALQTAPWDILEFNGKHRTIYVHAFTAFESVLHCFQYIEMLFKRQQVLRALPEMKHGSVAIIGAGPSGLLAARKLRTMGYHNLTIFEKASRWGGKSLTVPVVLPEDGNIVYCELGTCYVSPAYKPMIEALGIDNEVKNLGGRFYDSMFRGIVSDRSDRVVSFMDFMMGTQGVLSMICAVVKYRRIHLELMGSSRPFPPTPPLHSLMQQTFLEFLQTHGLDSLIPLLRYAHELQGYGNLSTIPAFYGLQWVVPDVVQTVLADGLLATLHLPQFTLVGIIERGWGSVWEKVIRDNELIIRTETEILSVVRKGTLISIHCRGPHPTNG